MGNEPTSANIWWSRIAAGANGTEIQLDWAQTYDPGDALAHVGVMIFAPQDVHGRCRCWRRKAVMNCVEEHDTCLTTAITSSQHLRGAAKPISTLQFGKTPGPSSKQPASVFITAQRDCLRRCTVGSAACGRHAAHDRQLTAASALPEALPIPATLPRTRDASTIEQRQCVSSR